MAARQPLGRDPLEWIKRTKPGQEEEKSDVEGPPQQEAESPPPAQAPASHVLGEQAEPAPSQHPAEEPPTEVLGAGESPAETAAERPVIKAPPEATDRYALPITVQQQPSLVFPIILIVCIFLMGYLVWLITSEKIRTVDRKVDALTKKVQMLENYLRK